MPLLDTMFRTNREDVQGLLKNLQLSTRYLHHMCGHSKVNRSSCGCDRMAVGFTITYAISAYHY